MIKFLTPLITEHLPNEPYKRKLYKPLVYEYEGKRYEIPESFVCDGASIPKIAWGIIGSPFSGRYVRAAFIHDYDYRIGIISRLKADIKFLAIMQFEKVARLKRKIMHRFVRLFAWLPYNRYRRLERDDTALDT